MTTRPPRGSCGTHSAVSRSSPRTVTCWWTHPAGPPTSPAPARAHRSASTCCWHTCLLIRPRWETSWLSSTSASSIQSRSRSPGLRRCSTRRTSGSGAKPMKICVCVKRVPMVGGTIRLTPDGLDLDTAMSGFTISPHEECAVEEAIQITARLGAGTGRPGGAPGGSTSGGTSSGPGGGGVTVLTLGPPEAADQLRDMLALGASRAILLETDGAEWGPIATAAAIADAVRADGYDLLLFGNESADTGGYQVPIRVAHALGLPCVTGIKKLQLVADPAADPAGDPTADPAGDPAAGGWRIVAGREYRGAEEIFDLPLPAVVSVKEGINLPRYPSLPGRLRAKRAAIDRVRPQRSAEELRKDGLRVPMSSHQRAQILGSGTGNGTDAVPALVELLAELGVLQ